ADFRFGKTTLGGDMKRINVTAVSFGAALMLAAGAAAGQEVVLRIHHFLPPQATIQVQFFTPWCEKLGKESAGRIKCQIYPAMHLHDGALLHFANKEVKTIDDIKGMKVRSPTRIGAKFLAAIGAAPVQMPLPQVPESMSKGVIDGAMVPWEGVPPIKLQEIAKYHLDNAPGAPRMSNTIFVVAMNQAKYGG